MGRRSQAINITFKFPEGKEKEVREHISKVLTEIYADAIVKKVRETVPEQEITDVLATTMKTLKEN